jgi:hypothetical protein
MNGVIPEKPMSDSAPVASGVDAPPPVRFVWKFACPEGWEILGRWGDGFALRQQGGGLRVLIDCEFKSDGQPWLHVSYSRKDWTPNHADTLSVKQAFIGDRYTYAVFPPSSLYVNIHEHCLHLWARMGGNDDGRVLPEFSGELENIGRSI